MPVSNLCFLLLICVAALASRPVVHGPRPSGSLALPGTSAPAKPPLPEKESLSALKKPSLPIASPPSGQPPARQAHPMPASLPSSSQQVSQPSSQAPSSSVHKRQTPTDKSQTAPLTLHTDHPAPVPRIPGYGLYTGPEPSVYISGSIYSQQQPYQRSLSSLSRYRGVSVQPDVHPRQFHQHREYQFSSDGMHTSFTPAYLLSPFYPTILPPTHFSPPGQDPEFFVGSTAPTDDFSSVKLPKESLVSEHAAMAADIPQPLAMKEAKRLSMLLDNHDVPAVAESQPPPPLKHVIRARPALYSAGYFGATPAAPLMHTRYYIVPRRNYHPLLTDAPPLVTARTKKGKKPLNKADWTRTMRNIYLSSFRYLPSARTDRLEASIQVERHALERRMQLFFPKGQLRIIFVPEDAKELGVAYPLFQPAPPNTPLFRYVQRTGKTTGTREDAALVLPDEACVVLHRFAVEEEAPEAMQPLLLILTFHSSRPAIRPAIYDQLVAMEREAYRLWSVDNRIGPTNPYGFTSLLETYPAPLAVLLPALRAALPGHADEPWQLHEDRARRLFPNAYLRTIEPSKQQAVRMTECFLEPFTRVHYPGSLLYSHGASVAEVRKGNVKTVHSINHNNEAAISVYSEPIASWIRSGFFPSRLALSPSRSSGSHQHHRNWRLDELRLFIEREDLEWSADFNDDISLLSIVHFRRMLKMTNGMRRCSAWVDRVRQVVDAYDSSITAFHAFGRRRRRHHQQQQQRQQLNPLSAPDKPLASKSDKQMIDGTPSKETHSPVYLAIRAHLRNFDVAVTAFARVRLAFPAVLFIQEAPDKRREYLRAAKLLRTAFIGVFERMEEVYEDGLNAALREYFSATYASSAFYDRDVLVRGRPSASLSRALPEVKAGTAIARLLQFRWQQTAIDEAVDRLLFTPTISDYEHHRRQQQQHKELSGEDEADAIHYRLAPDTRQLLRHIILDIPPVGQHEKEDLLHLVEFDDYCGDELPGDRDGRSDSSNSFYCCIDGRHEEGGRRPSPDEDEKRRRGGDAFLCLARTTDESSSISSSSHSIRGDDSSSPPLSASSGSPSSPLSIKRGSGKQSPTKLEQPKEEMPPRAKAIATAASASLQIAQSDWPRLTAANASLLATPAVAEAWHKLYADLCRSFAIAELSSSIDEYLGGYADSLQSSSKGSLRIERGTLSVAKGGGTLTALFPSHTRRSSSGQSAASLQAAGRYSLHYVPAGTPMATVVPHKSAKGISTRGGTRAAAYALDFDVLAWPLPSAASLFNGGGAVRGKTSARRRAGKQVKVKAKVELVQWVRVATTDSAGLSSGSSDSVPTLPSETTPISSGESSQSASLMAASVEES